MPKSKKALPKKEINRKLIVAGVGAIFLAIVMLAVSGGGLETTLVGKPAKLAQFEVAGSTQGSKTAIASSEKILFSWQLEKGGKFDHLKLERLDSDLKNGQGRELDMGSYQANRQANKVDLDIRPNWKEPKNTFRLSVCADAACSKASSRKVTFSVADYDENREEKDPVDPGAGKAIINSFTVQGNKQGIRVSSKEQLVFGWQLSEKGSFDHLELKQIVPSSEQEQTIDLGRFKNNRQVKDLDVQARALASDQVNIFRLLVCQDRACSQSNSAEVRVSVTDGQKVKPVEIVTKELPNGRQSKPYLDYTENKVTLTAKNGTGKYHWSVVDGELPTGIKLNPSTGVISGNTLSWGTFKFTVKVEDSMSPVPTSDTQEFELTIFED